jgi:hypothetical protein
LVKDDLVGMRAAGARNSASGELVHDDLLISAALCAVLDGEKWGATESAVIPAPDPLQGLGWSS